MIMVVAKRKMKLRINMMLPAFTAKKTENRKEKKKQPQLDDKLFFGHKRQWHIQVKVSRRQFILRSLDLGGESRETGHNYNCKART